MEYDPLRRGLAEFVGAFALIFIGAGSILTLGTVVGPQSTGPLSGLTLVGVALAHGLTIAVMASAATMPLWVASSERRSATSASMSLARCVISAHYRVTDGHSRNLRAVLIKCGKRQ